MNVRRGFLAGALMLMLMLVLAPSAAADYVARLNTRFPIPQRYTLVNDFIPMLRIARQAEVARKLDRQRPWHCRRHPGRESGPHRP